MHQYDPNYEPRLVDHNGDLSKRWYIDFRIWDTDKEIFVRKQYCGMNKLKTYKSRHAFSRKKLKEISDLIKQGYTVGAAKVSVKAYDIKKISLKEAYHFFLNTKNAYQGEGSKFDFHETYNKQSASISEGTFKNFRTTRKTFFKWLDDNDLSNLRLLQLTASTCLSFFDYLKEVRGVDDKTFNNYLNDLRGMAKFFIEREEDLTWKNPFLRVQKKSGKRSNSHVPYTNAQFNLIREKILEKNDQQLYLFIHFIYYLCARIGQEVRLLQVKDIQAHTVFIPSDRAKNDKGEHITISPGLEKLITEYKLRSYPPNYYIFTRRQKPGEKPVGKKYFYRRNEAILKELKLTDKEYTLYGYKHTGAINLYLACKDIKLVQQHLRHANSYQTDQYLRDLGVRRVQDGNNAFPDF